MRTHMAKVIVERPRGGGGEKEPKGIRRRWQRCPLDDLPRRESIGKKWGMGWRSKYLNENLAPLRRFLAGSVGRPWDKVFSELCQHIRIDSAVQKHVRDHVDDFVTRHVEIVGRTVRPLPGANGWGTLLRPYYVHPVTGLLRASPRQPRKPERPPETQLRIDPTHVIRQVDGLWYEIELAPYTDGPVYDVCLREELPSRARAWSDTDRRLRELYGAVLYGRSKRQLNSREIRRLSPQLARLALST